MQKNPAHPESSHCLANPTSEKLSESWVNHGKPIVLMVWNSGAHNPTTLFWEDPSMILRHCDVGSFWILYNRQFKVQQNHRATLSSNSSFTSSQTLLTFWKLLVRVIPSSMFLEGYNHLTNNTRINFTNLVLRKVSPIIYLVYVCRLYMLIHMI